MFTHIARRQADEIDAMMLEETMVFDRDQGRRQLRRQIFQPQRFPDEVAVGREGLARAVLQHQSGPPLRIHRGFGARQVVRSPDNDAPSTTNPQIARMTLHRSSHPYQRPAALRRDRARRGVRQPAR
jgi:hypothetical protein